MAAKAQNPSDRHARSSLSVKPPESTRVVILAGGRGTRLAPFTSVLPKPLMPVGDRAILEHVIEQLNRFGFTDITLSVGYLSHLIQAVFDHGSRHNARITYMHEDEPLGTAGPLRLIDGLDETFLVLNGDVLTTLDFGEVVRHHRASGALLTIATHKRKTKIDYGVLHIEAESDQPLVRISAYDEKPELDWLVSMGVYVMEPSVRDFIPERRAFDFPELVQALLQANEPVGAFLFEGLWLDIGRHEDYERATILLETNPTVLENDMELKYSRSPT